MPTKQRLAVKIFRIIEGEAEGPLAIWVFLVTPWPQSGSRPGLTVVIIDLFCGGGGPYSGASPRKATPNFLTASDCVMITPKKDRNHGTKQSNQHRT